MGFPSFLVAFFLISHVLVLHSSGSCPSSFDCRPLDPIKFPFTNNKHPLCGLCTVSCDERVPKVILGEDGRSYQVSNITHGTIKINDPELKTLVESNNCDFYSYITPFYNTPSVSFTISPNLTIFKYNTSNPELQREAYEYFHATHNSYEGSEGRYTVYYSYPNDQVQDPT